MWGIIRKGQLKTGYCRPNAVPLRLRRNHNYYYYYYIASVDQGNTVKKISFESKLKHVFLRLLAAIL